MERVSLCISMGDKKKNNRIRDKTTKKSKRYNRNSQKIEMVVCGIYGKVRGGQMEYKNYTMEIIFYYHYTDYYYYIHCFHPEGL